MRKRGRTDGNQQTIVKELRQIPGFSVAVTSGLGDGFPDIVVGHRGVTGVFEIKDPAQPPHKRKLTPDEKKWHDEWHGHARVVETTAEILREMRMLAHRNQPYEK